MSVFKSSWPASRSRPIKLSFWEAKQFKYPGVKLKSSIQEDISKGGRLSTGPLTIHESSANADELIWSSQLKQMLLDSATFSS